VVNLIAVTPAVLWTFC